MKYIITLSCIFLSPTYLKAQDSTSNLPKRDSGNSAFITDSVYSEVEIQAMYPGGQNSWMRYLAKHLTYPPQAANTEIQGHVSVRFIVYKNGTSGNYEVISGPNELRDESIRVIKNVRLWTPAINYGKKVNSFCIKTIPFILENQ